MPRMDRLGYIRFRRRRLYAVSMGLQAIKQRYGCPAIC